MFVPIALAIFLSFVLAPLVRVLERWHIPRPISVVGVVLLAFASIFLIGGMIAAQVTQLAGDLPRYELTMREKIKSLRGATAASGTLERAGHELSARGGRWGSDHCYRAARRVAARPYTNSRQAHVAPITGYPSNRLSVEQLRKRSLRFWNRTPTRNPLWNC